MTTMVIDLNKVKKPQDWTVTDVCRKLVAEESDVDRIEVYWGTKPSFIVTDVKRMAELKPDPRGGFRKYREDVLQPRTAV